MDKSEPARGSDTYKKRNKKMQTIHVTIIITATHPDPVKKLAILLLICTIQVRCEIKCSVGRKQTIHLKDAQNIQ